MHFTPFKSDIFYSVQNEDYKTEVEVVSSLGRGNLRALTIASSGENALSLLALSGVKHVTAVDTNPAQCQLCKLRESAIRHLSLHEHLLLFASGQAALAEDGASRRVKLYEYLADRLDPAAKEYWDARKNTDIAFGIMFTGRNDQLAMHIQQKLSAYGLDPLADFAQQDHERFVSAFTETYTLPLIKATFDIAGDVAAQRISEQAGSIARKYIKKLTAGRPDLNYLLTTFFKNSYAHYAGDEGYPLYLQPSVYSELREKIAGCRPVWITDSIVTFLEQNPASNTFDLISISNIADWLPAGDYEMLLRLVKKNLKKGGALVARKATGGYPLAEVTVKYLSVDHALSDKLISIERGPMWSDIVVAYNH